MTEQTQPISEGQIPLPPQPAVTSDDTTWAVIAHGSALITILFGVLTGGILCLVGPLVPLIIYLVFRQRSRFVARHAAQATIFQVLVLIVAVLAGVVGAVLVAIAWIASIALISAVVGICLVPIALLLTIVWLIVAFGLPVAALVYAVYGAYEVSQGRDFRYWLVGNWVN